MAAARALAPKQEGHDAGAAKKAPASPRGGTSSAWLQLATRVGRPGDPWEREADLAAELVVRGEPAPRVAPAPPAVQRCASCGADEPLPLQRMCRECADRELGAGKLERYVSTLPGAGERLPESARSELERGFGADFSSVRVHTDSDAADAAHAADARAFTHREHVAFAPGEYDPGSRAGKRLLAHELTHVVQQGAAPLRSSAAPVSPSAAAPPVQRQEAAPAAAPAQKSWLERGLDRAGDVVASGAGALKSGFIAAVRAVSPGLADIVEEGPFRYIKRRVTQAVESWIAGLVGDLDVGTAIGDFRKSIGNAFDFVVKLAKGDPDACAEFVSMLQAVKGLADVFFDNPAINALKKVLGMVSDAITSIAKLVLAPVFDLLKDVLGATWDLIKGIASTVWGWIKAVKDGVSWAWDQVASALGFTGDGEDGVWGWIKKHALAAWNEIKEALGPALGPLKTLAKVVFAFSGLGVIYVVVKYGPKVVEAVTWFWEHRNDPPGAENSETMGKQKLPELVTTAKNFGKTLGEAADWVVEQVSAAAESALSLAEKITGLPLVGAAHGFVKGLAAKAGELRVFAEKEFKAGAEWVKGIVKRVVAFVEPYKEVLSSIVMAIIDPPMIPVILAGWAWRKLPSCIKRPLINFILDIVIKALRALPELAFFGVLWPLLKEGIIGFLAGVRAMEDNVKEAFSNKMAKLMSGASPEFLFGFVKGFLIGVWEGISDPIKLLWTILEGITSAIDALGDWAGRFLSPAGSPKPEAAALAAAAAPAATAAPAPAPATPAAAPAAAAPGPAGPAPSAAAPAGPQGAAVAPAAPAGGEERGTFVKEDETGRGRAANTLLDMAKDLLGPVNVVTTNFFGALQEYFGGGAGGKKMSFGELVDKLGEAWGKLKESIGAAGASLAAKVVGFFQKDTSEADMGEGVGWVAGQFAFQALLDFLTAGAWEPIGDTMKALKPVITFIAKVINWPMEVMGEAMKLLKKVGGYVVEGVKGLVKMAREAAAGALKAVVEAVEKIGQKLVQYGEEIAGKLGGKAAGEGEAALEKGLAQTAGGEAKAVETQLLGDAATAVGREGEVAAQELEEGIRAARRTPEGHTIKVTEGGRIMKCSTCEDVIAGLESDYEHILGSRRDYLERLDELKAIANDPAKAAEAARLAEQLERDVHTAAQVEADLGEAGKLGGGGEVEGARDTGETTRPRTSSHSPEAVLEADLERNGMPRPDEFHEPHHIVPKRSMGGSAIEDIPSAERAREILRTEGVNINEAANGIWLPRTSEGVTAQAFSRHATIHTKVYYDELARRLEEGLARGDVAGELATIRDLISEGLFPH